MYPFLEYLLIDGEDTMIFPSFSFSCSTNILTNEDEESSQHVYFQNECTKSLLLYTSPSEDSEDNPFEDCFTGFVKSETKENTLYVFFDLVNFTLKNSSLVTMHEIINTHQFLDKTINRDVYSVFYENEELIYILDSDDKRVIIPHMLYKCTFNNGKYENEFREEEEYMSLINSKILHPIFKECYIFSTEPIESNTISNLKRFSVFLENPTYVTKNLSNISSKDSTFKMGNVIPSIVEYSKTLFSRKEPEEKTEDEVEEKTQDEQLEDAIKNYDCVYYHENQDNQENSYWLVKSTTHFVQL